MQNRDIFGIWLIHVTAAIDQFNASFQYTILSRTDDVEVLVIIRQLWLR